MASDSQAKDNTRLSANRPRLADRVKTISKGIRMYFYSEYTEDRGGLVNTNEAHQDGSVIGRYVQKDGKTVETFASPDAQITGDHKKIAEAAGVKKDDIRSTTPQAVARDMRSKEGTDLGKGPVEVGSVSSKQADTPGKPEQTEKANLHPKSKPKPNSGNKPKEGKPDSSLFKLKDSKDAGDEGDFKAEKAEMGKASKQSESKAGAPKEGKPDKSMSQMASIKTGPTDTKLEKAYDVKVEPGKITYSRSAPKQQATPNQPQKPKQHWKQSWESKSPAAKQAFRQKLSEDRWMKTPSGAGKVMRKADGEGPSEGYRALLAQMQKKKQSKPDTRDEKIEAALDRQKGRQRQGSKMDRNLHNSYEARRDASDNAKTEKAKPILLKDMARYKKFTASGRPFRVMMGTHPDHQSMIGAHHVLERPMSIKEVDAELKNPTSDLSRRVLDAVDGGHDSLYIHQPKSDGKQVGHLKVMKSISETAKRLAKNIVAGYGQSDQTGIPAEPLTMTKGPWAPTPHTSRPEIMNKGPKTHSQHARAFAVGVRQWLANRPDRMKQAKAQDEEAALDTGIRHMQKATPKTGAPAPAQQPVGAQTHNPK